MEKKDEPTKLDKLLAEGMAIEADKPTEELEVAEDHQKRLATYLGKMTRQAVQLMIALGEMESVKHEAAKDSKDLKEIQTYLQEPTKDKIVTDKKVEELQIKLNKIAEKYGIVDYSKN